jgi:signal peptidase I
VIARLESRLTVRSVAGWCLTLVVIGVWAVTFRPAVLNGPTAFVGVHGESMEPTMHQGDMAITRVHDTYEVGDVVAYRVPKGEKGEGNNVIHRIIGGSGDDGYVTQGDNNGYTDVWRPTDEDVIGEVWLHVPSLASWLGNLRRPGVLALLVGVVTFVVMALPDRRKRPVDDELSAGGGDGGVASVERGGTAPSTPRPSVLRNPATLALIGGVCAAVAVRRRSRG